jgi:hypothetical protein
MGGCWRQAAQRQQQLLQRLWRQRRQGWLRQQQCLRARQLALWWLQRQRLLWWWVQREQQLLLWLQ